MGHILTADNMRTRLRAEVAFLARKGPASLGASIMPGLVTYAIIVYLTYASGATSAGEYRLVLSIFAVAALFSLSETGKVVVRAVALDDKEALTSVILGRIGFAVVLASLAGICAFAFGLPSVMAGQAVGQVHIALLALGLTHGVFDSWLAVLQGRGAFGRSFIFAVLKYGSSLLAFTLLLLAGFSLASSALVQLGMMTLFNIICFFGLVVPRLKLPSTRAEASAMVKRTEPREGFVLSLANFLPGSMEHVDKFVVGAVFGLEALGLYTLCLSTARLLDNGLKPSLYIYYRRFASSLPTGKVLWLAGIAFTALGVVCTLIFIWLTANIPALAKFRGGEFIAAAVFLSYGVAMADSIYSQAYAIYPGTRSYHLLYANVASCVAVFACYLPFSLLPTAVALVAFALSQGFRHAATLLMLVALRRRQLHSAGQP